MSLTTTCLSICHDRAILPSERLGDYLLDGLHIWVLIVLDDRFETVALVGVSQQGEFRAPGAGAHVAHLQGLMIGSRPHAAFLFVVIVDLQRSYLAKYSDFVLLSFGFLASNNR